MPTFIAAFMGLVRFSLAMIGLDLFLINDDEYNRLRTLTLELGSRMKTRLRTRAPVGLS